MKKTWLLPTLRGVDEKPHKKAPIVKLYRGFLFYSLLTEAGAAIGYKVAMGFERNSYTMSRLALLSLSILLLYSVINTVCSFIVSVFFILVAPTVIFFITEYSSSVTSVNVKKISGLFVQARSSLFPLHFFFAYYINYIKQLKPCFLTAIA